MKYVFAFFVSALLVSCVASRVSEIHSSHYLKAKLVSQHIENDSIATATIQVKNTAKRSTYKNISINIVGINEKRDSLCWDAFLTHDSLRAGEKKNYNCTFAISKGTRGIRVEDVLGAFTK
jgi:hypothetical protein